MACVKATYLGRPLGHFVFSLIGFKRIIFRDIFQMVLRSILATYVSDLLGESRPSRKQELLV